jgi:hypothetical protein
MDARALVPLRCAGALVLVSLAACGSPYGDLPSCEDYCQRLRTSGGGCAGEAEDCERDCELWRREHADLGCERAFDDVLACTAETAEVCTAIREGCSPEWGAWADCVDRCDVASVGDVTFDPPCPPEAPCSSGTELTMTHAGPLECTSLAVLTCAGEPTYGFLPASDTMSVGTIELSCTQPSGCGLQTHTAFLGSSGGSTVASCTP